MPQRSVQVALPTLAHIFIGLLVLGSLAGCGNGPKDKLLGKWIGDRIENVSADDAARAAGWVKGTMWEFVGDRLTVTIPAEPSRTGTFKVTKAEGGKMNIRVARSDGQADETSVSLTDAKTMRWDIGDNREIVLVRAE
jgi:hypothetical protein